MSDAKKCAHDGCSCLAKADSKYCSTFCEDAQGTTTLKCDCGHPTCEAHTL